MAIALGPILQFRGIRGGQYQVSALLVLDLADPNPGNNGSVDSGATITACTCIAEVPFDSPRYAVWRFDINVKQKAAALSCSYQLAGLAGRFSVPAKGASPRIAYASCNGFSDPKLMKQVDSKYGRWLHMAELHEKQPYQLLMLGGDQVYSDEMWKSLKPLEAWTDLSREKRVAARWTRPMREAVDRFYAELYIKRWAQPEVAKMLQSVPGIMMWDDHDIFDGWGSYPKDLHGCDVYQGIFERAAAYFRVFQLQLAEGETHPAALPEQTAYNLGFDSLGDMAILAMDLRLERMPDPEQIVSPQSWDAIYAWLGQVAAPKHLLLMSSIPVAYLDLNQVESLLGTIPGQQELEDDLKDHWRSVPHSQERLRLIHRLLSFAEARSCRVTIVSGDVHVGAASAIESNRGSTANNASVINQLVSTGVVHPAPSAIIRYLLESIGSKPEAIDRGITATMLPIAGKGRYLIGARNWLALEPDDQGRIWANWHVEGLPQPITKVIHSVTP